MNIPKTPKSARKRITLNFIVEIEKGTIKAERIGDACAAAIRVFGVIEGEVLAGARITMSHITQGVSPKGLAYRRQRAAKKLDEAKAVCPECELSYAERVLRSETDDGESANRCPTCDTLLTSHAPEGFEFLDATMRKI